MWEKLSNDTGVTDFCIAINGWILFAVTYIRSEGESWATVIIFNHRVLDTEHYKEVE